MFPFFLLIFHCPQANLGQIFQSDNLSTLPENTYLSCSRRGLIPVAFFFVALEESSKAQVWADFLSVFPSIWSSQTPTSSMCADQVSPYVSTQYLVSPSGRLYFYNVVTYKNSSQRSTVFLRDRTI